jgi:hypothetical protein
MAPQFHGREHLNVKVLQTKLDQQDPEVLTALKHRSYAMVSSSGFPNIGYTAAFEFETLEENKKLEPIIAQGIADFEKVYGYAPKVFNSPGGREHPAIHECLMNNGIHYIETPFFKTEHQGGGTYKKVLNFTGKRNALNMIYSVRNVVFEPTFESSFSWVDFAMNQIDTAFFWNKPAIISSHRVNFCGHIEPSNRTAGLQALGELLKKITLKYPNVEFMGLGKLLETLFE